MIVSSQYLVATSHSILLVSTADESVTPYHTGYGLYYGLTWDDTALYAACRWYPWYTLTARIERPRLITFRPAHLPEFSLFPYRAGGLHQIAMHDTSLVCTCSREDALLIRRDDKWERWYPSPDHSAHNRDTHHFNSVWFHNDLLYVVGHNNGPSDIWVFSWPERNLVNKFRAGHRIHNVWRHNGSIAFCNSQHGSIETVDGDVLATPGGFPRGVAISDDQYAVGVSTIANRRQRTRTSGHISLYDTSWTEQTRIPLGECGQVLEVRRIDQHDYAHGPHPFPLSPALLDART